MGGPTHLGSGPIRRSAGWAVLGLTALMRTGALPDYVIIGAQKAGTTSMWEYLGQHPAIVHGRIKEVQYFTKRWGEGEHWYRTHFPHQRRHGTAREGGTHALTGEATPYYLFHPLAPQRAARVIPHAKIIVLLRDPVERALSHYGHERRLGHETLPVDQAIDREAERLRGEDSRLRRDPSYVSFAHQHFSYLARGLYADQLSAWYTHFPRKQFLVLDCAELFSSPATAVERVVRFLGLRPYGEYVFYAHNVGRASTTLDPDMRARLSDYFAEPNERLFGLLDRDLGWNG